MAATSSSYHLLNHIFRTPPSSAFRSFLFRRAFNATCCSSASTFAPLPAVNRRTSSRQAVSVGVSSSSPVDVRVPELIHTEVEEDSEFEDEIDGDGGNEVSVGDEGANEGEEVAEGPKLVLLDRSKLPKLTIKERKELASYAHSLGKKLKVQLVGKSGVTASLATSFVETLEANELLKIKIHATCPGEVPDVAKQLEDSTGSVVVGQIGRTIILYRPSFSKMKAEEKRRQERKVFVRKESVFKPAFPKKEGIPRPTEQTPRPNRRGTRGSCRMGTAE